MNKILIIGVIGILFGTTLLPSVMGINENNKETVNVTCCVHLNDTIQKITTTLSVKEAIDIQNERNEEKLFALLKKYDVISKNSSISSLRNEFYKWVINNLTFTQTLDIPFESNDDIFYNLLCFLRVDWTPDSRYFVPLFMFGNSPIRGWLNFPIWVTWGIFLSSLFRYIPILYTLLFIQSLIPSTDLIDIGIGGRFDYNIKTIGLLGEKVFDNAHKPQIFSLIGFHGYHITFGFPLEKGLIPYRSDTFIGFSVATIVIPE